MVAIGSPLGTYSNSVTSGIVSAKGRSITTDNNESLTNLIQTDAAINPGNSGGPLLDAGGNVIGINTAIASNSNGIGFAIPIDIARPIMAQAVAGEPLSRPYLGIHFVSITRQLADEQKLPVNVGALVGGFDANGDPVTGVEAGKPAATAGSRTATSSSASTARSSTRSIRSTRRSPSSRRATRSAVDVLRDGEHVTLTGHARDAAGRAVGPTRSARPAAARPQSSAASAAARPEVARGRRRPRGSSAGPMARR